MPIFDYVCTRVSCPLHWKAQERIVDTAEEAVECSLCHASLDRQVSCTPGIQANYTPRFHRRK